MTEEQDREFDEIYKEMSDAMFLETVGAIEDLEAMMRLSLGSSEIDNKRAQQAMKLAEWARSKGELSHALQFQYIAFIMSGISRLSNENVFVLRELQKLQQHEK